jgi:hypothetical protein
MPLLLRQLTNVIYELEGFAKVRKLEVLRDVVTFDDIPTVHLCFEGGEILTLERGHPSTARNACFGRQIGHRRSYSTTHPREAPPVHYCRSSELFGMKKDERLVQPNSLGCA